MKKVILGLTALAVLTVNPSAIAGVYWDDGQSHIIDNDSYWDDGFYLDFYANNVPGTQAFLVDGGVIGGLSAWHNSIVTMTGGSIARHLRAWHNATITMSGGSVGWYLDVNDNASITLSGGTIGTVLQATKNGTIYLYGRAFYVTDLEGNTTHLLPEDKLSDFGTLVEERSGSWIADYYTGTITGVLEDGSVLNNPFKIYNTGSVEGTADIIIKNMPMAYRPALAAMSQEGTGLLLKNNSNLTIVDDDGDNIVEGIIVNSLAEDAVLVQGKASISASNMSVAGSIDLKGSLSHPEEMRISENLGDDPFPGIDLDEPDYSELPDLCPVNPNTGKASPVVITDGEWILEPGYYSAGVIIQDATVTCLPGIYHLGGGLNTLGGLILKGDSVVDANEVMFHIVENGKVSVGNDAVLTATALTSGDYEKILFFQSHDNASTTVFRGSAQCGGRLYFPANHVEIAGDVLCSMLMADTIELASNAKLTVNPGYPSSE